MTQAALRDVWKRFGPVEALRGAELALAAGEIHALLGENGAGKTTLVRVLYGLVRPDRGQLEIDGRAVSLAGPRHALSLGIGLVHQHFMGVPALSVAENLLLGEPGPLALSASAARSRARSLLEEHGLELDPDAPAGSIGVARQQRLEIARALSRGARLLILDEPTAVLAPSEVEDLLALLLRLRGEGRTILFISHKLEEVSRVCDRVTVLRAGRTVGTREASNASALELAEWMVGDALPPPGRPAGAERRGPALRAERLRTPGLAEPSFEVQSGEILALAGIDGNGQGPLEELLAGVRPLSAGRLELLSGPLALLSGDRHETGLILELSLEENLVLEDAAAGGTPPAFRHGLVQSEARRSLTQAAIERFGIRGEPASLARTLSGGNQQKLCVARALHGDPGVLVVVNPTRGLDVASAAALRDELRGLARAGVAVLLISTDLDEVLELGDRIAVLFRGELSLVPEDQRTRSAIGARMLGETAA